MPFCNLVVQDLCLVEGLMCWKIKDTQREVRKVREGHKAEDEGGVVDHREADVLSGLPSFLSWVCHVGDMCSARPCFHLGAAHGSYLHWLIFTGSQKNKTNKSRNSATFVCLPSGFLRIWSEFGQAPGDHSATELICAIANNSSSCLQHTTAVWLSHWQGFNPYWVLQHNLITQDCISGQIVAELISSCPEHVVSNHLK